MSDQPSPMDPSHPDPLVPIVPPVSPGPDSPPVPIPTVDEQDGDQKVAHHVDQDAPGLSVLDEQDGDPVEPNEPG